ncbi:MAG: hypothetical protein K8R41_01765 [Bacteroidales bacterium]|nr:hypothetical protein [Bacteroidales bacterium]
MKTYKLIIGLALIFCFTAHQAIAEEFTKEIKKEFNVNSDALLKVKNKYGTIKCENWNKNVISIEVEIIVIASSDNKAEKMFNNIGINISGSKSLVKAITEYEGGSIFKNANIQINYYINMPKTLNVDIYQKYGSLFIEEVTGIAKLGIKYGALQAEILTNEKNEVYSAYSKATFDKFNSGIIDIQYSELSIDECKKIDLTTKYSSISIDEAEFINMESAYDNVSIDQISVIKNLSKFSNFSIDDISTSLSFELQYGNLEVDNIAPDFKMIKIENNYAGVELGISSNASYKLDADVKYGNIDLPESISNIDIKKISHTQKSYIGTVGKNNNPKSTVYIRSKHCSTSLY